MSKIIIIYKSITGFTKAYAQMLAEELECPSMDFKQVTAKALADFDTVIFGTRIHAGTLDGFPKAMKLFQENNIRHVLLFATGAVPSSETDTIQEFWKKNLSPEELSHIPHFYMQSGLRYERMTWGDKLMMKVFTFMLKRSKDSKETALAQTVSSSYDISSREYITPLVTYVKETWK